MQESRQSLRRPSATRKILRRVELVLRHHHAHPNTLRLIRVDEAPKVSRIGIEVARLLDEHILALMPDLVSANPVVLHPRIRLRLRIKMIPLHPTRRSPRRSPEPQLRLIALRRMNKRDQRLPVVLNAEMLQIEIAVRLVVAVGLSSEIVRTNRHAAVSKARSGNRVEEFVQHALAVLLAERLKRCPAKLIEAPSETLHRLCSTTLCWIDVQVKHVPAKRRLEERAILPRIYLRRSYKCDPAILQRLRRRQLRCHARVPPESGSHRARRNQRTAHYHLPPIPKPCVHEFAHHTLQI